MKSSAMTPLVIIEIKRDGKVMEYDRMRLTPDQYVHELWYVASQIGADENPDEVIVRILRPTRE